VRNHHMRGETQRAVPLGHLQIRVVTVLIKPGIDAQASVAVEIQLVT